jgi:predicted MPP superfamily phosphohydrolase
MSKSWIPFLIFFAVIFTAVTVSYLYMGVRLAATVAPNSRARSLIWLAMILTATTVVAAPFLVRFLRVSETGDHTAGLFPSGFLPTVAWTGFFLLGFMVIAVFLFVAVDVLRALAAVSHVDESRRDFLFRYGPWSAFGLASALTLRGFQTAMAGPRIEHVNISKSNLHKALQNFKIVQISDLHVGNLIRKPFVEKVVEQANAAEADLIAITGDLVDGTPEALREDVEPLKNLKSKYGIYYISGNHEYYSGWEQWREYFRKWNFRVLENAHEVIEIKTEGGSAKLTVAGMVDPTSSRFTPLEPDASEAIAGAPPSDFYLWLIHQPNFYKALENLPCDLQLSGHTHSGQFIPARFLIGLFHRYYRGLNRHENKFWIYVNRGTGFWGPPNRLGLPSELTVLKLTDDSSET